MTPSPRSGALRRSASAQQTPGALRRPRSRSTDVALVAVFAALVCALALAPAVPVGPVGVPITLQTLGIMLCGAVLGPWRGAAAAATYLVLGLAGLPVFAGGAGGLGVLAAPSAGFLLSYPLAALVVGALARLGRGGRGDVVALGAGCLLGGIGVVYAGGVAGICVNAGLGAAAAAASVALYVPGDLVKVVVAVLVAAPARRAFPQLVGAHRR
ncbi:biotin transporter BioY [Kineococcus glutinatus]|uniref:Biotin transporter n=1 Tax=Kineococcus glutinatus TaxID=1070872 RepID=A0ABP8VBG4_9ACTN